MMTTPPNGAAAVAKLLLSTREAAAALGISERTLWSLTRAGDLPCVRVGARVLYRVAALTEWAERAERGGPP